MSPSDWIDERDGQLPLSGVRVLDFSTLLPGPLATYLLAESGADVLKVERPGTGDEMRGIGPFTDDGAAIRFLLLNAGKRSVSLDLKSAAGRQRARALASEADVLVEQFRPGVMARLGLGYEALAADNPKLVYCSITGYGATGPKAATAAHDLNYAADAGLLSLVTDADGRPTLPPSTFADIAGGSYPAVINILLALLRCQRSGVGAHLDVAMAENLFTFVYWGVANGFAGHWPEPDAELLTGASPRYALYRTADDRWLAVGALEERFWRTFCELIGLDEALRDDAVDPGDTREAVAALVAARTAAQWEDVLGTADACVNVVRDLQEATSDPQVLARGIFARRVTLGAGGHEVPAAHVPVDPGLRRSDQVRAAPVLPDPS